MYDEDDEDYLEDEDFFDLAEEEVVQMHDLNRGFSFFTEADEEEETAADKAMDAYFNPFI